MRVLEAIQKEPDIDKASEDDRVHVANIRAITKTSDFTRFLSLYQYASGGGMDAFIARASCPQLVNGLWSISIINELKLLVLKKMENYEALQGAPHPRRDELSKM